MTVHAIPKGPNAQGPQDFIHVYLCDACGSVERGPSGQTMPKKWIRIPPRRPTQGGRYAPWGSEGEIPRLEVCSRECALTNPTAPRTDDEALQNVRDLFAKVLTDRLVDELTRKVCPDRPEPTEPVQESAGQPPATASP